MKNRTPVVEGLIFAVITVILCIISLYVPFINLLAMLVIPIPIVILGIRYNLQTSIAAVIATGVFVAASLEPQVGLKYLCIDGLLSILWVAAIRSRLSALKTLLVGIAGQVSGLILMLLVAVVNGMDIIGFANQWLSLLKSNAAEFSRQLVANYPHIGATEDVLVKMQHSIDFIITVLPALFFVVHVVKIFLVYKLLMKLLRRGGYEALDLPLIKYWDIPKAAIHFFLWSLVMIYMGNTKEIVWLQIIGNNLCLIMSGILLLQGMAVFYFLADKYSLSKGIRGIILVAVMVCYLPTAMMIMGMIGLFDIIFNYRKLERGNH